MTNAQASNTMWWVEIDSSGYPVVVSNDMPIVTNEGIFPQHGEKHNGIIVSSLISSSPELYGCLKDIASYSMFCKLDNEIQNAISSVITKIENNSAVLFHSDKDEFLPVNDLGDFTPGPWHIEMSHDDFPDIYSDSEEEVIGEQGLFQGDALKNAILIASAPEMYALLKHVAVDYSLAKMDNDTFENIEKALNKAEG